MIEHFGVKSNFCGLERSRGWEEKGSGSCAEKSGGFALLARRSAFACWSEVAGSRDT